VKRIIRSAARLRASAVAVPEQREVPVVLVTVLALLPREALDRVAQLGSSMRSR
jgi:hypothetical protein